MRGAREAAGHATLLLACEIDAQWLLADRLAAFRAAHPSVEVVVVYVLDTSALADLAPSRIDAVAVWGTPPPELAEDSTSLAVEDVHAVLRADDTLASDQGVTGRALAERTLWMWPPATGRRAWDFLVWHVGAPPSDVGTWAARSAARRRS